MALAAPEEVIEPVAGDFAFSDERLLYGLISEFGEYSCDERRANGGRVEEPSDGNPPRWYLHDDFNAVRLKKEVITQPPVLLWQEPAAAQKVPADVHEQLIEPLVKDEDT